MYKIQILFLFCLMLTFFSCQNKPKGEIHFFHGNWEEAKKEAIAQHKILFVDAYASWCGPCKSMDSKTFKDKEVADFFNKNFLNCHFDVEKKDGIEFAKEYAVNAYPTMFFIDAEKNKAYKILGFKKPEKLLMEARKAMDSELK